MPHTVCGGSAYQYFFRRAFDVGLHFARHHSRRKGEHSEPAREHQKSHDELGRGVETRRYARGETHSRDRGDALEGDVPEGDLRRLDGADDERRGEHEDEVDGEEGHCLLCEREVERALADDDVLMSAHGRVESEEYDHHSGDFHAARSRTAVAADEHQDLDEQHTAVRQLCDGDGVEARRPRGDSLEEADEEAFRCALAFQHRPALFECEDEERGQEDEDESRPQHDAGVQAILSVTEAFVPDVAPHHVAHAADEDEGADGEVDHPVAAVSREGGERRALYAHEVEARVAERGDGVEDGEPYASPAELGHEAEHEDARSRDLHREGEEEDAFDEFEDAALSETARGLRDEGALEKPYPSPESEGEQGDEGHEAQAAYLYEQQHDDLSESRPMQEGVHGDETGHAGGGCGDEQGVDEGGPAAVLCRNGQAKEKRPHQNDAEITQHQDLHCGRFPLQFAPLRFLSHNGRISRYHIMDPLPFRLILTYLRGARNDCAQMRRF